MEIERKYLIKELPEGLENFTKLEIEQGYLCRHPVVRIRKSNDDYILTYKMKQAGSGEDGNALINEEIEMPLTLEAYKHLKKKKDDHIIHKTRYVIPLPGGLKAELDIFHKRLEGLMLVEVEFESVDAAASFKPPNWFGKDVSDDKHYRNGFLSELDSYEGFLRPQ